MRLWDSWALSSGRKDVLTPWTSTYSQQEQRIDSQFLLWTRRSKCRVCSRGYPVCHQHPTDCEWDTLCCPDQGCVWLASALGVERLTIIIILLNLGMTSVVAFHCSSLVSLWCACLGVICCVWDIVLPVYPWPPCILEWQLPCDSRRRLERVVRRNGT